jgi:hypothetical protein
MDETMAIMLPKYGDWPEMLPAAVVIFAYRNLMAGYTPHLMNFGRNALMPLGI